MQQGWYCRSVAEAKAAAEEQERAREESKLKTQYKFLKGKMKHLIYENECFHQALRGAQKRLLEVTRDRTFLLNRLMIYEKPSDQSSSDSEDTESSEEEIIKAEPVIKKRRESQSIAQNNTPIVPNIPVANKILPQQQPQAVAAKPRKRPPPSRPQKLQNQHLLTTSGNTNASSSGILSDGHMTPEEVERHLQSRQSFLELERAPLTVPTEMFSNEPSLDSESNDIGEIETSPSNIGEEISIDMIAE